jgi:hypothetical protein
MTNLSNNKDKIYGGAWSVHDSLALKAIHNFSNHNIDIKDFCVAYKNWMAFDKNFKGWNDFKYLDFSNGTTETFDKFYQSHSNCRLRLLKGEYFYHQIQAKLIFKDRFEWIGDTPLIEGDVVVMSCPFSDTGNVPVGFDDILTECDRLSIPVLIDMAYISISDLDYLDLSHPCIQVITSSLSKVFPLEHYRIGIRMRREFIDDTLVAYNQNQYVNRYSLNLGYHMISSFTNNWLFKRYKEKQLQICTALNVEPSSCVIFGIDKSDKFITLNRGNNSNRLCFSRIWDGRVI